MHSRKWKQLPLCWYHFFSTINNADSLMYTIARRANNRIHSTTALRDSKCLRCDATVPSLCFHQSGAVNVELQNRYGYGRASVFINTIAHYTHTRSCLSWQSIFSAIDQNHLLNFCTFSLLPSPAVSNTVGLANCGGDQVRLISVCSVYVRNCHQIGEIR